MQILYTEREGGREGGGSKAASHQLRSTEREHSTNADVEVVKHF